MAAVRYRAQLDDIPLALEYVNDSGSVSYAEYEYPDVAGSDFEYLGPRARTFDCRAWFINDSYEGYIAFEEAVNTRNAVHNFVHPTRGLIVGVVVSYSISHDDRERTAIVDFQFKEQLQGEIEERLTPLITPQIEELFEQGQVAAITSYKDRIIGLLGPDAAPILSRTVSAVSSLASQFVAATRAVRAHVLKVDAAITQAEGLLTTVAQPADSLIASINYGNTLPGRLNGTIAATIDRYKALATEVAGSPYLVLQAFYNGTLGLRNAVTGFEAETDRMRAMTGAHLAAELFKADDDNRAAAEMIAQTSAWNGNGEYVGRAPMPAVLTVNDLERILVLVRTHLQAALDHDRSVTVLQEMAAVLLRHVNAIKINRERVVEIDVPTEIPLHLLCHSRGLGYNAAERVLALNPNIQDPSFVSGMVSIYE